MGVGFFDYAPDGQIKRVAINNAHQDGVLTDTTNGTFLAMWDGETSTARALQRPALMGAASRLTNLNDSNTNFTGLFPSARLVIDSGQVEVHLWSGLVPHDIERSALPVVHIDVTLRNQGSVMKDVAVALSWQDVISRNIFDADSEQLDKHYPPGCGPVTCAQDVNELMSKMYDGGNNCTLNGRTRCRDMQRASTFASEFSINASALASLVGVEQHTAGQDPEPKQAHYATI